MEEILRRIIGGFLVLIGIVLIVISNSINKILSAIGGTTRGFIIYFILFLIGFILIFCGVKFLRKD